MSERRAFIGRSLIHDVQHHWNKYNIHRIIFAMNITNITRPYKSIPSRRWNFRHIACIKKRDSPSRSLPKKIIFSRRRIRKKEKVISREKRARHIFTRNILAICVALFHVTNNADKLAKLSLQCCYLCTTHTFGASIQLGRYKLLSRPVRQTRNFEIPSDPYVVSVCHSTSLYLPVRDASTAFVRVFPAIDVVNRAIRVRAGK